MIGAEGSKSIHLSTMSIWFFLLYAIEYFKRIKMNLE